MERFRPVWMSQNETRALWAVKKERDPKKLEQIASKAPLSAVREAAATKREKLLEYAAQASLAAAEHCPKCGAAMVEAEYYSAAQGKAAVTNVEKDWASGKTTYATTTQYSNIHRHTGSLCVSCVSKRTRAVRKASLSALLFGVVIMIFAVILFLTGEGKNLLGGLLAGIAGFVLTWIGWSYTSQYAYQCGVKRGRNGLAVTTPEVRADEALHDDVSTLFVSFTPVSKIPMAEGNTVALHRTQVRAMREGHNAPGI